MYTKYDGRERFLNWKKLARYRYMALITMVSWYHYIKHLNITKNCQITEEKKQQQHINTQ